MKPWNTVIFDIDDTLYDQMVPFRKACEAVLGGKGLDAEALYSARGKRGMEALQKVTDGLWTMEQNHIYRTKAGCADLGVAISDEEALRFQQVYARHSSSCGFPPSWHRFWIYARGRTGIRVLLQMDLLIIREKNS